MFWFAAASLTPVLCLVLACLFGGPWPLVSVLSITVFVFFMDRLVSRLMPETTSASGLTLSYALVASHGLLWMLGIWAIGAGVHLDMLDKALILIGIGLYFGQISNSNAHELIHKSARLPRRLGLAVYCSILFGHHVSAHRLVHHRYAGTSMDPNTAQLGEGFWGYLIRAWGAGFVAGKRAEDVLRRQSAAKATPLSHPYVDYVIGSGLALLAAALIAGFSGALALLLVSAYAQVQLYLSDYVQHYGLHRRIEPSGRPEPVGPQHSWNAPHWYSSAMMLNAPRHSDHHVNPARDYPSLRLTPGEMPILPHSLPVMAVIALVPPLWRRLMDKRARRWRDAAHEPVETDWKYRSIHATLVA